MSIATSLSTSHIAQHSPHKWHLLACARIAQACDPECADNDRFSRMATENIRLHLCFAPDIAARLFCNCVRRAFSLFATRRTLATVLAFIALRYGGRDATSTLNYQARRRLGDRGRWSRSSNVHAQRRCYPDGQDDRRGMG